MGAWIGEPTPSIYSGIPGLRIFWIRMSHNYDMTSDGN
jgi:hypothetical protein